MLEETSAGERDSRATGVRTFLVSDIRGYTRFSHEHGDEAASRLAHRFAEIVRKAVPARGGELLELRGDEALCVFGSAREALRAAVELQRRFRERIDGEPALPIGVGVGLEAGEAVPTEGGYRGRALNVAARLCGLARAGEILASETVATLAGRDEGMTYAPRRPARLKGLAEPVRVVAVVPVVELPPIPPPPSEAAVRGGLWRARRRAWLLGLVGAALVVAALVAFFASRTRSGGITVAPNSVAVIDPKTNRVVGSVPVGDGPTRIAIGDGKIWVLNKSAQTLSLIDAGKRALVKTFGVGASPADIAVGLGSVWVGDSATSSVLQLDPDTAVVVRRFEAPPLTPPPIRRPLGDAGGIAFTPHSLWFASGNATISRIDPASGRVLARVRYRSVVPSDAAYVASGAGAIWVSACCGAVTRVDPRTNSSAGVALPAAGPVAAGLGGVWVADVGHESVWEIDPRSNNLVGAIRAGRPLDVALGEGAVWVASSDGTVSRIDPVSDDVTRTIRLGGTPAGIAVGEGAVWVAVD